MPKLAFLRLCDVVLTPSSGPSLVRCELDFTQWFYKKFFKNPRTDVYSLFRRLGGLCHLETLKLINYPVDCMELPDTIVPLSLPKLASLELDSYYHSGRLAEMLDTPHVQRIGIVFRGDTGLEHDLERYLPTNAREYLSLRELSFWFGKIGFFNGDHFLDQIGSLVEKSPQVEWLTVLTGEWDGEEDHCNDPRIRIFHSEGHDIRDALSTLNADANLGDTKLSTRLEVVRQKATNNYMVVLREKD